VGELVSMQQRRTIIAPLLNDPLKSIRIAAAEVLLDLPITKQNLSVFNKAFNELSIANKSSIWRGEGRVNQGNHALKQNDVLGAQKAYQASIDIDPYFPAGYTNSADLYRAKQREDLVADVLSQGLKALPDSAEVAYSFGLHLVRVKNIKQAITYFEHAMQLNAKNMRFAYTYVLALDGNNQTTLAIAELKRVIGKYSDNQALIELGQHLAKKTNSKSDFNWFTRANRLISAK
jgi:tetratricopeptide (TPR) repeat protein